MSHRPCTIYLILDESESPRYVGRSFNPSRRPLDHLRKYPEWATSFRLLEVVADGDRWQDRERFWIAYYRRFAPLENIARGGGSAGPKSLDTVRRQREKVTGRRHSAEAIARIREAIRSRSNQRKAEIGRRISEAKQGKSPILSDAERKRRSEAMKGKAVFAGRKHSPETIAILRIKNSHPPNSGSFKKGNYPARWLK